MKLLKSIFSRIVGSVNRTLWRRVEWLALRLLAASSRRLIAHRQSRRVHSEAWRRTTVIPMQPYTPERGARWN